MGIQVCINSFYEKSSTLLLNFQKITDNLGSAKS